MREEDPRPPETVLVTGFPSFTAARMARKLLADRDTSVIVLVREPDARRAESWRASLPEAPKRRLSLLTGDPADIDLGLAGNEVKALAGKVTTIHHIAAGKPTSPAETPGRTHVDRTRGILAFAEESRRLRRVCHWSTAFVSGRRKGVVLEEELDEGQRFHGAWEESRFEAEKLARASQRRLPITILRPGTVVGDSQSGEIDRLDGPYAFVVLLLESPLDVHLPLPGRGAAPLHLVPIDFVVDAGHALSLDERAAGGTFHLTDPSPLSARQIYELVAERAHKKRPRGFIPAGLTRTIMRTPGLEKLARAPLAVVDSFDQLTFYNCRRTLELLEGTGIHCPTFDRYVDPLVRYVRGVHAERRARREDEVVDPFE